VRFLTGKEYILDVNTSDTIEMVKFQVYLMTGTEIWRMRFILARANSKILLENSKTDKEYNVSDGSCIYVCLLLGRGE